MDPLTIIVAIGIICAILGFVKPFPGDKRPR